MKKIVSICGVAVMVIISGCASAVRTTERNPASNDVASLAFVPGNQYQQQVTSLLSSAQSTIDVLQFNFASDSGFTQTLAQTLIAKKKAGRTVRVIMEKEGFGAGTKNTKTQALLQQAGIEVHLVTGLMKGGSELGIEHAKVVIVDGHKILAGSTNWTNTSIQKNNETDLLIDSKGFAQELTSYIDAIISNSGVLHSGTSSEGNVTMYRDSDYYDALISFIGKARKGDRLDCSMYLFNIQDQTDPNDRGGHILQALADAVTKSGVTLRLMLETSNASFESAIVGFNEAAAKELVAKTSTNKSALQLFWDDPTIISHQKFCVLTQGKDRSVIMGSSNWNYIDLDANHQVNWQVDHAGAFGDQLFSFFDKTVKSEGTAYTGQ